MHAEAARGCAVTPVDDQPAERARLGEVQLDPGVRIVGFGYPAGSAERLTGIEAWKRARCARPCVGRRTVILDREIADPQRAGATVARDDGELDRSEMLRHVAACGTPGELECAAVDSKALPARRRLQVLVNVPPDVLPARVDELDLDVVAATHAAQPESNRVVLGHLMPHRTAGDDESRSSFEIEIQPQRRSSAGRRRNKRELRLAGGDRRPERCIQGDIPDALGPAHHEAAATIPGGEPEVSAGF